MPLLLSFQPSRTVSICDVYTSDVVSYWCCWTNTSFQLIIPLRLEIYLLLLFLPFYFFFNFYFLNISPFPVYFLFYPVQKWVSTQTEVPTHEKPDLKWWEVRNGITWGLWGLGWMLLLLSKIWCVELGFLSFSFSSLSLVPYFSSFYHSF